MPRHYSMSWEGHPHYRWVKMFTGVRYRVNCSELPIDRTKYTRVGSATAANAWWDARRREVELTEHQAHPQRKHLDELQERLRVGQALDVPAAELRELAVDR